MAAWEEALRHFPRRAEIWGLLADLILPDDGPLDAGQRTDIAFEALVAKPSSQHLLALWAAISDDGKRDARLRQAALCLGTPPEQGLGPGREASKRLATPSQGL